jgi:hypothetical protein
LTRTTRAPERSVNPTSEAASELDVVSDTVGELTGHAPMDLAGFLRRYPESYRHLVHT